jgi:hypothetical protein
MFEPAVPAVLHALHTLALHTLALYALALHALAVHAHALPLRGRLSMAIDRSGSGENRDRGRCEKSASWLHGRPLLRKLGQGLTSGP